MTHRLVLTRDGGLATEGEQLSRCLKCGCEKLSIAGAATTGTGWITRYCFPDATPRLIVDKAPACAPVPEQTIDRDGSPKDLTWRWYPR